MSAGAVLAPDAQMVLGIASTAMPFARTREDAAERWLRILRSHGEVGAALQALGVSEAPRSLPTEGDRERDAHSTVEERDTVARVSEYATRIAGERGAKGVATTDVLMAVMHIYGADFDRVLQAHGANRDELIELLGATARGPRGGVDEANDGPVNG
jgi:hypothetical protein